MITNSEKLSDFSDPGSLYRYMCPIYNSKYITFSFSVCVWGGRIGVCFIIPCITFSLLSVFNIYRFDRVLQQSLITIFEEHSTVILQDYTYFQSLWNLHT